MTTRRRVLQAAAIQGLAGCLGPVFAQSKPGGTPRNDAGNDQPTVHADEQIARVLAPIRDAHHLPGLVGAILANGRLMIGAVGARKLGSPEPIGVNDQVHLGSNTKAMTATLIGTLVDQGKLSWGSTIRDVFPDLAPQLHPGFQAVTLSQLLTHRSGLAGNVEPDNPNGNDLRTNLALVTAMFVARNRTPTEQRRSILKVLMKNPPLNKPGSTFSYSNRGYMVAGLMAEQVTGQSWETLMKHRLFEPLGMSTAGFGPPGRPGQVDQPWGHVPSGDKIEPTQEDRLLPPVAGPAGTVHCSVPDWSKFVALHLAAAQGKAKLLNLSTFQALQTPPAGFVYAGGWNVINPPGAGGRVLFHDGTNGAWCTSAWLVPAHNAAILLATNEGGGVATAALSKAFAALVRPADLPADVFAPPR